MATATRSNSPGIEQTAAAVSPAAIQLALRMSMTAPPASVGRNGLPCAAALVLC
jgi:hypothetical protein